MATIITSAQAAAAWPGFSSLAAAEQTQLLADVTDAIETYCGRVFTGGVVSYTEYHDGANRPRIWLKHRPVVTVTSVTINGTALDNSNNDAWTVNTDTGELIRGDGQDDPRFASWFPRGTRNVVVVYTAGFSAVPSGVQRAALAWLKTLSDVGRVGGAYKSESIGEYSYTAGDLSAASMPGLVALLLSRYTEEAIA